MAAGVQISTDDGGRGLETAVAELSALQDVAADILGHLDLEGTLLSVLNAVVRLAEADIAGILLADDGDQVLRMRACTGHRTTETAALVVRRGQGVAGRVFASGHSVRVDDYLTDSSISRHFASIAEADGTRSALGVPMIVRDHTVGVLMAWRRRSLAFNDAHERAMTHLAHLAAMAIENARLYQAELDTVDRLTETNRRLEEQYGILRRAADAQAELTNLVLEGRGLGDLAATVARQIDGEAAILDGERRLLASSHGGAGLAAATAPQLADACEREGAAGTTVVPSPGGEHWLIVARVAAGGDALGHLCVGVPRPPERFDSAIVEQAAIVCALELTRAQAVSEARTRVRADFVWDLVSGAIDDPAEARVRAHALGYAFPTPSRVALVRVAREPASRDGGAGGAGAETIADWWLDALTRTAERAASALTGSPAWAVRRGPVILLVLQAPERPAEARALGEAVLRRLAEDHPDLRAAAGMSTCAHAMDELPKAYRDAQHALSAAPSVASGSPVAVLDDLGVLRFLLAPGNRGDLMGFAHRVLGPAVDYDREHRSELIPTVATYLEQDCNLQRTSEQLYVHAKTVRYRLDRVQELTGADLAQQQTRFDVQMAITILRALSLGEDPA